MEFAVGSCLHECRTFCKRGKLLVSQSHIQTCCAHTDTHTPQPLLPGEKKTPLSFFTRLFFKSPNKEMSLSSEMKELQCLLFDWLISFIAALLEVSRWAPPLLAPSKQLPHTFVHESKFSDSKSAYLYLPTCLALVEAFMKCVCL